MEREFKYGSGLSQSLRDMESVTIEEPNNPELSWKTDKPWMYCKWEIKAHKFKDKIDMLSENIKGHLASSTVLVKTCLQGVSGWKTIEQM